MHLSCNQHMPTAITDVYSSCWHMFHWLCSFVRHNRPAVLLNSGSTMKIGAILHTTLRSAPYSTMHKARSNLARQEPPRACKWHAPYYVHMLAAALARITTRISDQSHRNAKQYKSHGVALCLAARKELGRGLAQACSRLRPRLIHQLAEHRLPVSQQLRGRCILLQYPSVHDQHLV